MKFQEQKRDAEYEAMAKDISRQVALVDIQDHRKRIAIDTKDAKEHRHRKRSVIQMKNGAPVHNSEEATDEEPVP